MPLDEAIDLIEKIIGEQLEYKDGDQREADHKWWISNLSKFERLCPDWQQEFTVRKTFEDIDDST